MKSAFLNIATLLTGLLLLINSFSYLGEYHFTLELLTHFRLQYLALFLISGLFFIIFQNKKWFLISLLGVSLNIFPVLSIYLPDVENTGESNNKVSLLLTNVLSSNQSYALLLNEIQLKQADFIVVLELSPQWANQLKAIDKNYPYQKVIPRADNFGIGLYSKFPLENISVIDFAQNGIPSIIATSRFGSKHLNIIATHPLPPMNGSLAEQQKIHLDKLAGLIRSKTDTATKPTLVLVAGDFNSTPWSPSYKKLISSTGLKNTRQGNGIYPTWSAGGLIGFLLQIPLDHVLVSENIFTHKIEKLDSIGSDHLPIYVELEF